MPRRNYLVIFAAALVSLACYQTADRNPLGRYFSDVADLIEHRYVDNVDRATLWSGAVRGMLSELGDPYSEYFPPREAADFEELLTGEFGGIGVQVSVDPQSRRLTVISPIVGSPAYKAGILAGDVITAIDGKSTKDMRYDEATSRIRGAPGEPVEITVERTGESEPKKFSVHREVINVDSVLGDTHSGDDRWEYLIRRNPNIGYLRIASFGEHTVSEMQTAMEQLKLRGVEGLVIDMRNDPGGLLPAARDVCDMFLAEGKPIVKIKGRDPRFDKQYSATASGEKFLNLPMAVLLNNHSASAAEIVAAALQDSGRAVVIGERSYGKGTVQNVIELPGREGMIKLTTAGYLRPNGKNIHRRPDAKETDEWGVSPTGGFTVKQSAEEEKQWMQWRRDRDVVRPHGNLPAAEATDQKAQETLKNDTPLKRALEYLESQLKKSVKSPAAA